MSELISGKDALIALANGEEVQIKCVKDDEWHDSTLWTVRELLRWQGEFRLKPRTITINNIEVPTPFEPKKGEAFYHITPSQNKGYFYNTNECFHQFGAWRTEEEIKQVVAALREVFNPSN